MLEIKINSEYVKLDQFMKFTNLVSTGGEAKNIINDGLVLVNGEVEKRRGKKLRINDTVEYKGEVYSIV